MKMLTGGDPVTARFLNREFFTFTPVAKFVLAVNHKPRVRDYSPGFWRRMRLVPFEARFEGKAADRPLEEKLLTELPGILAWGVRGCLEWRERGLEPPGPWRRRPPGTAPTVTRSSDSSPSVVAADEARLHGAAAWAAYASGPSRRGSARLSASPATASSGCLRATSQASHQGRQHLPRRAPPRCGGAHPAGGGEGVKAVRADPGFP